MSNFQLISWQSMWIPFTAIRENPPILNLFTVLVYKVTMCNELEHEGTP